MLLLEGWGCGARKAAWVTSLSFCMMEDGVPLPSFCTDYYCHLRLIQSSAALRPHLLLRMSDRTAATYDQTLLSLCTCDCSLREALMCCQQCSPLSCLDLPSPSVSVKQHWAEDKRKKGGLLIPYLCIHQWIYLTWTKPAVFSSTAKVQKYIQLPLYINMVIHFRIYIFGIILQHISRYTDQYGGYA